MAFLFFMASLVGAYFTWKYIYSENIKKGNGKIVSNIAGVGAGFVIWLLVIIFGVLPPSDKVKDTDIVSAEKLYIQEQNLTGESIKSISSEIVSADVYEQYAGTTYNAGMKYNIDVNLNSGVLWGGAQDWNSIAMKIFSLSKTLFSRADVGKISYIIWNEDHTIDWARIEVDKTLLPQKWEDVTYLQFFSYIQPTNVSSDAKQWLSEFYSKYSSASPYSN